MKSTMNTQVCIFDFIVLAPCKATASTDEKKVGDENDQHQSGSSQQPGGLYRTQHS